MASCPKTALEKLTEITEAKIIGETLNGEKLERINSKPKIAPPRGAFNAAERPDESPLTTSIFVFFSSGWAHKLQDEILY